jgi:hypothetical protein
MKPSLTQAIYSLITEKDTTYTHDATNILDWDIAESPTRETQPTEAAITAELSRLQSIYDNAQYARDRAKAYPAIAEQLDDIYHNGVAGWKASIKAVKDQFPK